MIFCEYFFAGCFFVYTDNFYIITLCNITTIMRNDATFFLVFTSSIKK